MSGDRPVPTGPDSPGGSGATAAGSSSKDAPASPETPDALAADVARQREELAVTVEELQARLDVKTRMTGAMTTADGSLRPELVGALVAGVVAVAGLLVLRWRRSR
ncbi:DUF3618 domain-containing protein [Nocardioides sp. zg-DK7169]|uniref:DUF3618 domain-containing protein n=1 Tax=Nocardioides sp. zg-DK7169 TaxID=2736600 RepID=UPI0015564B8E|nr:DUF3618 domain-containing protein [Nocardioides sp. zg-DK7169]NPC95731.1 DUF3618 domain-containing protein [Nocardioides sp. zg-DK7169]